MKTRFSVKTLCGCVVLLAALPTWGAAQAAPPAQAQQPASACGNQPACYEANDFVATITDFRTSTGGGGWKLIDMRLHFQNKTNQQLILGYTEGSAMAIDDQGNRYQLAGGANAVRGIGRVAGNIDPKFVLQPGGAGDALFELAWLPGGGVAQGQNFETDLSIREITALEGHQFALAGEVPLQFRGLANGVTAASGGGAGAAGQVQGAGFAGTTAPVCPPGTSGIGSTASTAANTVNSATGQNATAPANSAMTQASATISSFKSLFGKKKAAAATTAPAPAPGSSAVNCVPASASNSAAGASAPGVSAAPMVVTAPVSPATPTAAASPSAVSPASAATPAAAATPSATGTAKPMARTVKVATAQAAKPTATATPKPAVKPAPKKPAPAATNQQSQ